MFEVTTIDIQLKNKHTIGLLPLSPIRAYDSEDRKIEKMGNEVDKLQGNKDDDYIQDALEDLFIRSETQSAKKLGYIIVSEDKDKIIKEAMDLGLCGVLFQELLGRVESKKKKQ